MSKLKPNECGKIGGLKSGQIAKEKREVNIKKYKQNPKLCKFCQKPIDYDKQRNKFCNHSCAASFCNIGITRNGENREKPCEECGETTINTKFCSHKCAKCSQAKEREEQIRNGLYTYTHSGNTVLRGFLIKERGYQCEKCKNAEWMGQPIPLNVHHHNGDASDNLPSNICLLCLNCHGLTPNYGAKNKNSKRTYRYKKK